MDPSFRIAGAGDVLDVLEMMREYYAGEGYPFDERRARAALERLIADPSLGRVWIVDDAGAAGYVVLAFGYSLEYLGRDAFVDELFLRSGHRGRGLGQRALALLEETCRELGVNALHLEVERGNERARELYRRSGFVDHDRLLMTKRIVREPA